VTDAPTLEVLVPADGSAPIRPDDAESALAELYRSPETPWLRANMIGTLDGAATGPDGVTESINEPADNRVFATLRALADVVLVGAGTVRAEGYRAPRVNPPLLPGRRERNQAEHPALAILTRTGRLPVATLTDDPAPWVFTTPGNTELAHLRRHLPAERLHVHEGTNVDLATVTATLTGAGLVQQLTEGGPRLLAQLVMAGAVDELCLTWSPVLVGGPAQRILSTVAWLGPPVTLSLAHLLHADGVLIGRWIVDTGSRRAHA
jgi:riboflavin biosynthesis pyrimidine reductase